MASIRERIDRRTTLSFEFFPPKTELGGEKLRSTIDILEKVEPDFVSITYGAGGSTRDTTRDTVVDLCADRSFPAMPHLTCVGHSYAEIHDLVDDYEASGVHNVLALAGDPPNDGSPNPGDFRYAMELIEAVRERTDMCIGVAAFPEIHPRSTSREHDRRHLAEKLEAADFGITQFFFDADDYFRMVDELDALGCDTPVLPGVIPVLNPESVKRFADMNGTRTPAALWQRISATEPGEQRLEVAVDAASELIDQLLQRGAPGIHIYTLNQSEPALRISERIDALRGI